MGKIIVGILGYVLISFISKSVSFCFDITICVTNKNQEKKKKSQELITCQDVCFHTTHWVVCRTMLALPPPPWHTERSTYCEHPARYTQVTQQPFSHTDEDSPFFQGWLHPIGKWNKLKARELD